MGIDDLLGKAKDALADHKDAVDGAIDKAEAFAKDKAPDQADGFLDNVAHKAKDALEK